MRSSGVEEPRNPSTQAKATEKPGDWGWTRKWGPLLEEAAGEEDGSCWVWQRWMAKGKKVQGTFFIGCFGLYPSIWGQAEWLSLSSIKKGPGHQTVCSFLDKAHDSPWLSRNPWGWMSTMTFWTHSLPGLLQDGPELHGWWVLPFPAKMLHHHF